MAEKILDVQNLVVTFDTYQGSVQAVRGVSFHVNKKETVGIVGESGCGKSVTIRTVMGLNPKKNGSVKDGQALFEGRDVLQLSETRHFQLEEIARIFRVPLHLINSLDHATYSNIEHQSIEFIKYSISPWVIRIEQEMEKSLLLPSEKGKYTIKMNVDGLMRGDYKSRMEGYAIGRNGGWLSTNDIREMENMNPVSEEEGGDLYLVNGAMCKLSDAGIYADKPKEDTATNRKRGK